MNKNMIKKFAMDARNKLIASVTDRAGMLGITPEGCSEAVTKGVDFEVYKTAAGTEVTLNRNQCEQRKKLVYQINSRGFEAVIEEVAYTWFNRICAVRFMEVNDYMYPVRVRVLSSEKEGKSEPDILTMAPDIEWDFTDKEREYIIEAKVGNKLDDLFKMLFIKQCNLLHKILPELFEETEDYTEMLLNISFTNKDDVVRMLVDGVDEKDFNVNTLDESGNPTGQVEIIGWLYQYYNTELKDDTFAKLKKNIKISKERIPAATQLFTPDWIVRYMVENSVGRIWIEHLRANDSAVNEKEIAEKFGWKYYLPEAEQEENVNKKLVEIRTSYKDLKPEDITCIDPCMGSGHILIAMFDVLMDIYESTGWDKRDAAFEIVEHNIHGLDIDKRAYQLAYFAVMMKGRGYNRRFFRGKDNIMPKPKVYAIMESNGIEKKHLQFFGKSFDESERNIAFKQIEYLLDTFVDAREYGSILKIDECNWEILDRFVCDLNLEGQYSFESIGSEETQEKLRKLICIAKVMSKKYEAVVTNPPYMGASNMNATLNKFIKDNYADYKSDFFSAFIIKCSNMAKPQAYLGFLTPYVWMFIQSYEKLRQYLFTKATIEELIQFEYSAFEEATVPICTFVFKNSYVDKKGCYLRLTEFKGGMEVQRQKTLEAISNKNCGYYYEQNAKQYKKIPGSPVAYWVNENVAKAFDSGKTLSSVARTRQGLASSDNNRFLKLWWEPSFAKIGFGMENAEIAKKSKRKWFPCNKGGEFRKWYGNNVYVVNWENDGQEMLEYAAKLYGSPTRTIKNIAYYFQGGMTWGTITSGKLSMRHSPVGFIPEHAGGMIPLPHWGEKEEYLLGMMNSNTAMLFLSFLSPTLLFTEGSVGLVPILYDKRHIDNIANLVNDCESNSVLDWDSFETSWDFQHHPLIRNVPTIIEAFDQWRVECADRFHQLKVNEEELNRIFIDIYGLQDELKPKVEDKDVTIRKADLGRDIRSFISYAVGCMFGRYSLDVEGLVYAGGSWDNSKYQTVIPDMDNVILITDEEYFSDDIVNRFVEFVKTVYGADTLESNLEFIAAALGNKGDTSREVIRNYFLKDFYVDHLKVYQKRPIYWLFDSGRQNGFKALIYMHRYNADTVGKVRTDYLHKVQKYIETAMQNAQYIIENSASSSEKSKATKAVTKYTKQLAEMRIYDEAIAHIANQRIEIDLDDGVKVNYAKFQGIEVAQEGKKALKIDLLAKI